MSIGATPDHSTTPTGPSDPQVKARILRDLHTGPGFVLPNVWDVGSARLLEQVGFPALATTSAGIAWARGVPDGVALDRDTMLAEVAEIVAAVAVPVSADLEDGYGRTSEEVGQTVREAMAAGAVGGNIEDSRDGALLGADEAADRIDAPTLFSLGVVRVSVGGSLARAVFSLVERAGQELLTSGTLGFLDGAPSYAEVQRRFAP